MVTILSFQKYGKDLNEEEKAALELSVALARAENPDFESVSVPHQVAAARYLNEHGIEKTLELTRSTDVASDSRDIPRFIHRINAAMQEELSESGVDMVQLIRNSHAKVGHAATLRVLENVLLAADLPSAAHTMDAWMLSIGLSPT
jgi:ATP-dependent helicase/DNAse subunit B